MKRLIQPVNLLLIIFINLLFNANINFSSAEGPIQPKWLRRDITTGSAVATYIDAVANINQGETKEERGNRFKKFYTAFFGGDGTIIPDTEMVWEANDSNYWEYVGEADKDYSWELYIFTMPQDYTFTEGYIRWLAWGGSYWSVYVYRWNHNDNKFVKIDDNYEDPKVLRSIYFADSGWFDEDRKLYILFKSWTVPGGRWIISDALYLDYKE
jgi:hypothetical protein